MGYRQKAEAGFVTAAMNTRHSRLGTGCGQCLFYHF
jgi:hypothetical protein